VTGRQPFGFGAAYDLWLVDKPQNHFLRRNGIRLSCEYRHVPQHATLDKGTADD